MPGPVLATKLFMPPPRPNAVARARLLERLGVAKGRGRALTLVSAPAGFGKTTLLSAWIGQRVRRDPSLRVAWLSLDEGDRDPARFMLSLAAALNGAEPGCGADALAVLHSPQPTSVEAILIDLVNEVDGAARDIILVLDDYHAVHSPVIDELLGFLLEHLPARLGVVIATREDPNLPLARLRARGELAEMRAADLRFSAAEASEFLGRVMGLSLSGDNVAALESRTEGWIAGLQLAALSLQGQDDVAGFIQSFTGSHRFVLDYLAEEVLRHQPEAIQAFLLQTSILDRFCGPLCDALTKGEPGRGQETLGYLERSNLFIVPLDGERRWYRYHRLFGELLRQRLEQGGAPAATAVTALHARASGWYEANDLLIEAFHHASAASDLDRAERLVQDRRMPLHFRGAVGSILDWLGSLPPDVLDARPALRLLTGSLALVAGRTTGVEEALDAADRALLPAPAGIATNELRGRIAGARATLALTRYQADAVMTQSHRALDLLPAGSSQPRFTALWTMAFAHLLQGDRVAAGQALAQLECKSRGVGDVFYSQLALCGLGEVQVLDTRLHQARDTYQRALDLFGDHPLPNAGEAHLGLARIQYEWNDLDEADEHTGRSLMLARQYESTVDRFVLGEIMLARVMAARGQAAAAAARLEALAATARRLRFLHRLPEIALYQVRVLLCLDHAQPAAALAAAFEMPEIRARVSLAQGKPAAALALLEPVRNQVAARGWQDELLRVRTLEAVALHAHGRGDEALGVLAQVLGPAEEGGFVRLFLDEGAPMARLLAFAADRGMGQGYTAALLSAFEAERREGCGASTESVLSQRELEVLRLLAEGLSNQEIGDRLFLALDTIKGHNRRIFDKLEVKRRTEAIARGRELGLL
jgi:LuxR family transcriptional regulator, maltose regulon positive regulatory protein